MLLLRRFTTYLQDVVDTVSDVLAADDPVLCECTDDRWCVDCSLMQAEVAPRPWPSAPLDVA